MVLGPVLMGDKVLADILRYMLCGHSHYSYPATQVDSADGLTLDCGWDGHAKPLLFDEIVSIMNQKQIRKADHHVK